MLCPKCKSACCPVVGLRNTYFCYRCQKTFGDYLPPETPIQYQEAALSLEVPVMLVKVTLPYPVSVNRRLVVREGRCFNDPKTRAYKQRCAEIIGQEWPSAPFSGRVALNVTLHPRLTQKGTESRVCVDLSNCLKVAEDALIGIVIDDDDQVDEIIIRRGEPVQDGALVIIVSKK